jgi:NADPH:quinone reductase-like Zn-dependent oxidoreductase
MNAARIHAFGGPDVIVVEDVPRPTPGSHELLIRVTAAGVGPWDALIRAGKSTIQPPFPFILGSELAGSVEQVGDAVSSFRVGDRVYGATNPDFIGGYTEFAVASAESLALAPKSLNDLEAASAPVVAVTAWQMVHEYGEATSGQTVLIHGGAGNVGAYAIQLARRAGLHIVATSSTADVDFVRSLGADEVLDYTAGDFARAVSNVDIVLDTVGGETRMRSAKVVRPGGILVSVVTPFPAERTIPGIRTAFFFVEVTTARLTTLTTLFERGELEPHVGSVLPLEKARLAHEMLAGAPHARGKIVLSVA